MISLMPVLLVAVIVGATVAITRHSRHAAHAAELGSFARSTATPTAAPRNATPRSARPRSATPGDAVTAQPANPTLEAALERWLGAGLISGEQARDIELHEAELARAQSARATKQELHRRVPVTAEALGYLGGTLGIVGLTLLVARYWADMAAPGRLTLSGGAAMLLALAGFLVDEGAEPAFTRLRWFLWLMSSVAGALFAGVMATQVFDADAPTTVVLAVSAVVAAQNVLFWAGAQRPLQQLLALAGATVTAGALVDQFTGQVAVGTAVWVTGAAVLTLGLLHRTTFPPLTTSVGAISMIAGTAIAAEPLHGAGYIVMMLTVFGLLALAATTLDIGGPQERLALTIIGAVGALQTLPMTIGHFAQQAGVATGLVVWIAGAALVFAASRAAVRSPVAVEVVGGVALVAGAALTGVQSPAFATIFGLATAIGLIALGTMPGRVLLSLFGSLGLMVNVPWTILHFFPGEGRVPLLILASGAVIVLVAVWMARLGGRFRRELRR
ncbi:MAG: DUF2157 domain-containing protein [Actinomycetota bacterium]|nr:DUF2157 domain-containing protein [Actinomycetota bacterium]